MADDQQPSGVTDRGIRAATTRNLPMLRVRLGDEQTVSREEDGEIKRYVGRARAARDSERKAKAQNDGDELVVDGAIALELVREGAEILGVER